MKLTVKNSNEPTDFSRMRERLDGSLWDTRAVSVYENGAHWFFTVPRFPRPLSETNMRLPSMLPRDYSFLVSGIEVKARPWLRRGSVAPEWQPLSRPGSLRFILGSKIFVEAPTDVEEDFMPSLLIPGLQNFSVELDMAWQSYEKVRVEIHGAMYRTFN